ncbi:MAG: hypothetical protein KCCBMMGE_00674 [Candidatus Methanoperedenaceae archaeon GB37]|nr:MAG: hypothetical protein KCCBMMGE_00674 [Candidatus Methanoperedenaceae archaeon GB37]CAD7780557.1 hypothetical protein DMNBHIDG_02389 [Candidatus Methanoperedenaceae archaeon GB37]
MGYQNLKMTNDKAQMSNQAIWHLDFEIWIFLNCLWPDFDVALPIPNTYEDVTIIIGNK